MKLAIIDLAATVAMWLDVKAAVDGLNVWVCLICVEHADVIEIISKRDGESRGIRNCDAQNYEPCLERISSIDRKTTLFKHVIHYKTEAHRKMYFPLGLCKGLACLPIIILSLVENDFLELISQYATADHSNEGVPRKILSHFRDC